MRKKAYKRRQYIVDTRFQYSLMSKFAILTACVVIGSLSFLVLVYHKYGDIKVSVVQPIPFGLFDSLVDNGAWVHCLAGTIIFTFFFSLIVSHRMAEPVYRMRGQLNEMENGDLSWLVSDLRKKDEFKHLFADINKVKERWRLQVQDLHLTCRELGKNGSQEQHLKRIKEIVSLFKM